MPWKYVVYSDDAALGVECKYNYIHFITLLSNSDLRYAYHDDVMCLYNRLVPTDETHMYKGEVSQSNECIVQQVRNYYKTNHNLESIVTNQELRSLGNPMLGR